MLGKTSFSISALLDILQLSSSDWFIKSYFVLMIIAPILNTYCRTVDEKTQRYVMISFFLFESVYGWAAGGRRFFVDGYGPLHFIGLYITAQYIHNQLKEATAPIWLEKICTMPKWADMSIFIILALLNTALVVIGSLYLGNTRPVRSLVYAYSNPLVVIGALYLLLYFSKMNMKYRKYVNLCGASSFAVYLFHGEPTIRSEFFNPPIQYLYGAYSGLSCVFFFFLFLCLVYITSVLIDQLRILSWNNIWNLFENKKS